MFLDFRLILTKEFLSTEAPGWDTQCQVPDFRRGIDIWACALWDTISGTCYLPIKQGKSLWDVVLCLESIQHPGSIERSRPLFQPRSPAVLLMSAEFKWWEWKKTNPGKQAKDLDFFFFNQVDESDSFMCSHNCHSELDEGNTYFMSENPKLHYFHSVVSRSSIYFVKYRPCQRNLCHGAFGVCSCRSHLDMVGIRKSFLCPRVRLQTLAFVGSVGKPHPSPLPSVNT